jgi:hypothetical protein
MMEKKRHVAMVSPSNSDDELSSLFRAIDASITSKNLSLSSVKDVENSLHDVHVSVDSRDMGKIVRSLPLTTSLISNGRNVGKPPTQSLGDGKSVKSYTAPSFDEAASVFSCLSMSGDSVAVTPTVGGKMIWNDLGGKC